MFPPSSRHCAPPPARCRLPGTEASRSRRAEPVGCSLPPAPRRPEQGWAVTGLSRCCTVGVSGPGAGRGARLWLYNTAWRTRLQRAGSLGELKERTGGWHAFRQGGSAGVGTRCGGLGPAPEGPSAWLWAALYVRE